MATGDTRARLRGVAPCGRAHDERAPHEGRAAPALPAPGQDLASVPVRTVPFVAYGAMPAGLRFAHVERLSTRVRKYNWELAPHRHRDLYQLLFLADGAGEIAFDLHALELEAPALVLVPPLVVHRFAFTPKSRAFLLTLAESYFEELGALLRASDARELFPRPRVFPLSPGSVRLQQIALAYRVLEEQGEADLERATPLLSANLLVVLGAAIQHARARPPERGPSSRAQLLFARFRRLVEERYVERCAVAAYAETLGTTERTLHRASLSVAGVSPLKIIHRRILIEAQRRLLYTADSVAGIGYSLGFDDPAHFSRFFSDNAGESPAAFRRRRLG